jgi:pseudouridine synthase
MLVRLQKYLADLGVASRRKCEEFILAGRVRVDGVVVRELGVKVDPDRQQVSLDEAVFSTKSPKVFLMLNKPRGYVTTTRDPHAKRLVMNLIPPKLGRLYPVGRLDADTEGLLLLTNDGDRANRIAHPKFGVEKEYLVEVRGRPSIEAIRAAREGVLLNEEAKEWTSPCKARLEGYDPVSQTSLIRMVVAEGKKRQIRRLWEALGHRVESLMRIRIGALELGDLGVGEYRLLSAQEVDLATQRRPKRKKSGVD